MATTEIEKTELCNSTNCLYAPKADVFESQENITIQADIPGADENTIDIELEKNILTINAVIPETKYQGYSLKYSEYATGNYRRSFTLSNEINRDGIEAVVKNGVLKLTLPKSKESLPRKITVTGG